MRALILTLAVLAAFPASAQTRTDSLARPPSREALLLGARIARTADPRLEQNLKGLVDKVAADYRERAASTGEAINDKLLTEVTANEQEDARDLLWSSMGRLYAETYTFDELQALANFYRDNPTAPHLPTSLAAKDDDLKARELDFASQIGPRVVQDFFGEYCARAKTCSDATKHNAGLPVGKPSG